MVLLPNDGYERFSGMKRGIEKAINVVCGNIDPKTGERGKGELDKFSNPVTGEVIAQVGAFPRTMTRPSGRS